MKKLHLFKRTLLLLALIVGCVNYGWAETYVKVTNSNDLVSGGVYIIATASSIATSYSSSNFNTTNSGFTESSGTITTSTASPMEFTLGVISNNYTLKMSDDKYLGYSGSSTSFRNSQTSASATNEQWTIAYNDTYKLFTIVNVKTTTRFIGTGNSVFKVYANMTNNAPATLYKKQTASVTSLSVKTAPTKTNYKIGETLNLTGLVLNADGNDVTSGYTASPANGATLSEVGEKTVTISYGGQETTQTIHVGSLQSIAITTPPTKTEYNQGQDFDATGMVVKATFSDEETTPTVWEETIAAGDYSVDPSTNLQPANTSVTVSYTWNEVEETANQTITVNAATAYTVTFNAGTGTCGTSSLTEAAGLAGVTLPSATGISGWDFAGWATAATGNTEVAPTLYTAGSTYHPTDNCTLYAVYKMTDGVAGEYKRATSLSDITSAGSVVIVYSTTAALNASESTIGKTSAPIESDGIISNQTSTVFTLSGNNTDGFTLTGSGCTLGASGNNAVVSNTTDNSLWTFESSESGTNNFVLLNKSWTNNGIQYYSSNFKVYTNASYSSNSSFAMKVYVPNETTVYNSNPAAIINPTVAFTTAGDKKLYVQNENSYTNVANVTGIVKTPVYTSSDATVATVSDAGVVTALKAGTTTIKATVAAEVGVNTEASASYVVTVKTASNVAGLKAITDASSVVTFTADLTDAVVTYVNGDHAYIQDASGAVYASCGSSLTVGKKINGAVSGSIKAANQIDEITAIDLSDAKITDGAIPSAEVKTAAELVAEKASLEGKLVQIVGATVTASLNNGSASGGKISDDGKTTEINLYAPDSNIEALKDAEGTFNGYITLYGGSTIRFNIYDQSQIVLTKNAPTAQTLSFESDAVELDEVTPAFAAFTGQTVEGAIGDVTYSIEDGDDESGVVSSINASTGAVVLSGAYGTATITATAAAKEVTEAGVTTPYTETAKSYTVTVNPRYMVTFSVNDVETVLRQATSGDPIAVPTPAACGDYTFVGWSTSTVAPTDDKPSMTDLGATVTPENNNGKYYAVYAIATGTPLVEHTSTFTIALASAPSSPVVDDGSSWTWSNLTFTTTNNGACINKTNGTVTVTLPDGGKAVSLNITKTGNPWAGEAAVVLKDASSNTLKTYTGSSLTYNFTEEHNQSESYTLTNTTGKNAWIDHITFEYTTGGVSYSDYRTSLPTVEVTITDAQYATFCYARELNVEGTGVTAYTASANGEGEAVTLTKISDNIIPANTGVILFAETAGNYEINVSETDKAAIGGNELVGVTTRTQIPETSAGMYNYIFSKKGDVIGFYRASGAYLLPNRAYLSTSKRDAAAREFMAIMFDEGETTSLREIRNEELGIKNAEFFNLNGQRVATPVKGNIYIVNGKKVMFK